MVPQAEGPQDCSIFFIFFKNLH